MESRWPQFKVVCPVCDNTIAEPTDEFAADDARVHNKHTVRPTELQQLAAHGRDAEIGPRESARLHTLADTALYAVATWHA